MSGRNIIVIGASAGGVETLSELVNTFPPDLPAAVFVVLHLPAGSYSALPQILNRKGPLPARHPTNGEKIVSGQIYVAPPDNHLLIRDDHIRLSRGPRENSARPAIDPLFRSAARWHGPHTIGVVLSGVLDDGTAGLQSIKARSGVAVVQDPETALYNGMPRSAVENVMVDYVMPVSEMGDLLVRLSKEIVQEGEKPVNEEMEIETDVVEMDEDALQDPTRPGTPSVFACPDCGGVLWEIEEGDLFRFRCRVGHAFSSDTLLFAQNEALEEALWTALRAWKRALQWANVWQNVCRSAVMKWAQTALQNRLPMPADAPCSSVEPSSKESRFPPTIRKSPNLHHARQQMTM